jgi:PAS domain S-box-containing protein
MNESFDAAVLNSLPAQIAVLDSQGMIISANESWRQCVRQNLAPPLVKGEIGCNYLESCRTSVELSPQQIKEYLKGLATVLNGSLVELQWEYSRHTPGDTHCFLLCAVSLHGKTSGIILQHTNITSYKHAELMLLSSREQLQLMLDSTAEGIYGLDLKGRCTFCNAAALRLLGYAKRDDVLGRSMHDLIHHTRPDGKPYPLQDCHIYQAFWQGKGTHIDDEVLWRRDGTRFPAEYWSYPVRKNGNVVGAVVTFLDITERKQAEAALMASEARYRAVVETQLELICRFRPDTVLTFVNDAYCRYFGKSREALLGTSFLLLAPPSARESIREHITSLLDHPRLITFEHEVIRFDKQIGWQQWVDYAIYDDQGRIIEFQAVGRDVTDRKLAQERLRTERNRARQYFDVAGVILMVLDSNGVISQINRKGCEVLGYDEAEIIGKNWFDTFLPAAVKGKVRSAFAKLLTGAIEGVEQFENPVRCRNGRMRLITWHNALLRDNTGQIQFTLSSGEDITEQRAAEEQLRRVQKMEAIGHLTGGIAHDFNNLLAIVLGNLELLKERLVVQSDLQDLVQRAFTAAERGASLTQRLLAFSRQQPLQAQSVDLNGLVMGMLDLLQRTLGETIQIQIELSEELWRAFVDPGQLENALLNLALNARDAMPQGGTLIIETAISQLDDSYAAAHDDVRAGQYVLLLVSDTGTGMAPEVRERAFEPFFTTKGVGKGSGLGLSMVYGLVKQSGGHVKIYSELGQGTTVKVYLPRTSAETEAIETPETAEYEPCDREATILVVEDDPGVRQLAVNMLHNLGYCTVEAQDADTALQVLDSTPRVELLFTDVVLPGGKSGMDLAQEAQRRRPDLKVLFTSGYAKRILTQQGILKKDVELICKPYRKASLASKLRAILSQSC